METAGIAGQKGATMGELIMLGSGNLELHNMVAATENQAWDNISTKLVYSMCCGPLGELYHRYDVHFNNNTVYLH